MLAYSLAIFTGAFLLFLVQPLIGKFILPWFGGTPAVWTTCMLFFQTLLLGGYAYAHFSIRWLRPRAQAVVHLALLLAALALALWLIPPDNGWKPADPGNPMWRILVLLFITLGLPYFVLSATGPLLQAWFSQTRPGASPYRLYALSNVGSLLALVGYPFVVEPNLTRRDQANLWSAGLGVFVLVCGYCAVSLWKKSAKPVEPPPGHGTSEPEEISAVRRLLWFFLPACASVLLLAVTNKICQDIAVIPFLWVLPLSFYLVSFIVSFDSPRWYWRPVWLSGLVLALGAVVWIMLGKPVPDSASIWLRPVVWLLDHAVQAPRMLTEITVYLTAMFIGCMVCHGELYRLRPSPKHLTAFYLMIAAGGAFGGLLVALVAPLVFRSYAELHWGFWACCLLAVLALFHDPASPLHGGRPRWARDVLIVVLVGLAIALYGDEPEEWKQILTRSRNFYGVLTAYESGKDTPSNHRIVLQHGGTTHGLQFVAPDKQRLATTYYTKSSGVGLTMRHFPRQINRRIGVVGLGTATVTAHGKPGDYIRIYEINPEVKQIAQTRFTYLSNCEARVEIILGDARLSLEREAPQQFDILVLDAFSSDAIPVHLLTKECFETYQRHMKPDGVICVHISNRYLNLQPVVLGLADHFRFPCAIIDDDDVDEREEDEETSGAYNSEWMLVTRNDEFLQTKQIRDATDEPAGDFHRIRLWTDEESNLFKILSF